MERREFLRLGTWKPAALAPSGTFSNSALLRLLRSHATCKNTGLHSGERVIADKDEVGGSTPPRPTIRSLTSGNADLSSALGSITGQQQGRWSATLYGPTPPPDQHVCRLLGLSRRLLFGRTAVVERITFCG